MRDDRVRQMFERELEIPDVVQEKMHEAYRQMGADMDKIEKTSYQKYIGRRGTRYVKAASFILFALMVTTTVQAAASGGFQKLSRLFGGGDVSQIQSSSETPKVSSNKSTFKDLDVSVEQVLGTEEISYIVLKVKRTDGKTFDKDMDYYFKQVAMRGENDLYDEQPGSGREDGAEEGAGSGAAGGAGAEGDYTISIKGNGGEMQTDGMEQRCVIDQGIMIENQGTNEIYLAVVYGYERKQDGVSSFHKGEKCLLKLRGLCGGTDGKEGEESMCIKGTTEVEFVLDYGDCPKKVIEPGKKIKLPKLNSMKKYISAGTLDRVIVTPYFIQYERTFSRDAIDKSTMTWDQVYLEMDDGTRVGYQTLDSWLEQEGGRGGYGIGIDGKYKDYLLFQKLIDVEHVKAVYFGKTRIEL